MTIIAYHKKRLSYICVILLFFILIFAVAAAILRSLFPTPHLDAVEKYARDNQIKATMIYAVIKAESGFRSSVVSPKGAVGLMQITESTGKWIASELGITEFTTEKLTIPS